MPCWLRPDWTTTIDPKTFRKMHTLENQIDLAEQGQSLVIYHVTYYTGSDIRTRHEKYVLAPNKAAAHFLVRQSIVGQNVAIANCYPTRTISLIVGKVSGGCDHDVPLIVWMRAGGEIDCAVSADVPRFTQGPPDQETGQTEPVETDDFLFRVGEMFDLSDADEAKALALLS